MNFKFLNTSLHAMYRFALSVEGRGGVSIRVRRKCLKVKGGKVYLKVKKKKSRSLNVNIELLSDPAV